MPEASRMDEKILAWRVSALFRYGRILMTANFLNSLILVLAYGSALNPWVLWPWALAQTGFTAQRSWSLWRFFKDESRGFKTPPRQWAWSFFRAALFSGLTWAAWVLAWGPALPFNLVIIECVLLACLTLVGLCNFLPAYYAFCLPLWAAYAIFSFQHPQLFSSGFGFHGIPLLLILLFLAHFLNRSLMATYRLRFLNMDLLDNLSAAKRKAEEALASKNRFLAAASHDLRQPLHAQGLFLHALLNDRSTGLPRGILGKLQATHQALGHMLDGLLDLSLTESGALTPHPRSFPLKPLFAKLAAEFSALARRKGLSFSSRAPELWTESDPELLERMLRNLLSNAIRYTKKGKVELHCRRQKSFLFLEVLDTGPGIAPSEKEKVFTEFYQIKNSGRNSAQGLGLGLSIVRGLSRVLGHPVTLVSLPRLRRGCVFSVKIPLARPAQRSPRLTRPSRFHGQAILVLDDDRAIREGLRKILKSWNLTPLCVSSGAEALALLRKKGQTPPQILLCDYHLGGKETGEQALTRIRAALKKDLPTIMITGDASPERVRAARALGLSLLFKPLDPLKLRAALEKILTVSAQKQTL